MRYFRLFFLPVFIFSLVGCVTVEETVDQPVKDEIVVGGNDAVVESGVDKVDVVVDDSGEEISDDNSVWQDPVAFKEYIENNSNFVVIEDEELKNDFTVSQYACSHMDPFFEKVREGDIASIKISDELSLYTTPNYEAWTTEKLRENFALCGELGDVFPLKAYPDHLLWVWSNCGGGCDSDTEDSCEWIDRCEKAMSAVDDYLENELDYVPYDEIENEEEQEDNDLEIEELDVEETDADVFE